MQYLNQHCHPVILVISPRIFSLTNPMTYRIWMLKIYLKKCWKKNKNELEIQFLTVPRPMELEKSKWMCKNLPCAFRITFLCRRCHSSDWRAGCFRRCWFRLFSWWWWNEWWRCHIHTTFRCLRNKNQFSSFNVLFDLIWFVNPLIRNKLIPSFCTFSKATPKMNRENIKFSTNLAQKIESCSNEWI